MFAGGVLWLFCGLASSTIAVASRLRFQLTAGFVVRRLALPVKRQDAVCIRRAVVETLRLPPDRAPVSPEGPARPGGSVHQPDGSLRCRSVLRTRPASALMTSCPPVEAEAGPQHGRRATVAGPSDGSQACSR